ncbi:MAG: (2Fe-2S)-binding protein [Burkholderiaceae bacterium]
MTKQSGDNSVNSPGDLAPSPGDRRRFLNGCRAGLALACALPSLARTANAATRYEPAALVDQNGQALRASNVQVNKEYIFHYPFKSTPCFLIRLDKPAAGGSSLAKADGSDYIWKGGVGEDQSIVAFSAICAHKLTHPSPMVSFIGYREQPVGFYNQKTKAVEQKAGIIQCCSEHSIYDPAQGARVMSGPAPQPLAAIELIEMQGQLVATGVYGGDLFDRYFEEFGNRLMIQHEGDGYLAPVTQEAVVMPGDEFTQNRIQCG